MEAALLSYLAGFTALTEEERIAIGEALTVRRFKKGTFLLQEGAVSKECYFILEGCVRQFHIIDGLEKTTAFFTEHEAIVSFTSYNNGVAAGHYLVCVEDVLLITGEPGAEEEMYTRFPKLGAITRQMMEQDMGVMQDALARFRMSSAEERYLDLLHTRPGLLQRVPQHQLASYLGVTPESLSRIRKRIMANK